MLQLAQQRLSEQLGWSSHEIARRLHTLNFTAEDRQRVIAAAPHIESAMDRIVHDFYEIQLEDSDISSIIGDIDTLKRLKGVMRSYILDIFACEFDESYANGRLRIGKVHKRLGVTPKLYIGSLSALQSLLEREIDEAMENDSAETAKFALQKILLLDVQIIFEAYIDGFLAEMDLAKREVERFSLDLGIKMPPIARRLHEIASRDSHTGLYNQGAFYDYLSRECSVAERHHLPLTLMYLDLNGFKGVNDTHGHRVGDIVLKQVAESMSAIMRSVDIPARYGGDEFCIIMPRTTLTEAQFLVHRLAENFTARCSYPVTFSTGLVQSGPDKFEDPQAMVKKADANMYKAKERAKQDGKHHVEG